MESRDKILQVLEKMYAEIAPPELSEKLNMKIYTAVRDIAPQLTEEQLKNYIQSHPEIQKTILNGYKDKLLYRQPVVLLLAYLAKEHRSKLKKSWPYTEKELAPLFIDLGINPYNYIE